MTSGGNRKAYLMATCLAIAVIVPLCDSRCSTDLLVDAPAPAPAPEPEVGGGYQSNATTCYRVTGGGAQNITCLPPNSCCGGEQGLCAAPCGDTPCCGIYDLEWQCCGGQCCRTSKCCMKMATLIMKCCEEGNDCC